jgi:hypothetical protein
LDPKSAGRTQYQFASVVSDIMGVSSKNMLHAIAGGVDDPEFLTEQIDIMNQEVARRTV